MSLFILAFLGHSLLFGQKSSASQLMEIGRDLHYQAFYDSAKNVFLKAQAAFEASGNIEGIIEAQYAHSESLTNLGKCALADSLIKAAIDLSKKSFGATSELIADGYYYESRVLGGCSRKFNDALSSIRKSVEIRSELFGVESLEVADCYSLMGYFYNALGNYDSAEVFLTRAIQIRDDLEDAGSLEYSHALFFLAKTYDSKGSLKEALALGAQSLSIRKELLRSDHPTISNSLTDLGNVYKKLGNFEEALSYFLPALEMRKRSLGSNHVNVAASYYNIGNLYGNMFNYQRAIQFIQQGNLIVEESLGERLPILHTYYAYLGRMYGKAGENEKATEMLVKAQKLAEEHLDANHPYLGIIYDIIGQHYGEIDEVDTQIFYLKKAQKIIQIAYGKEHLREADILLNLGAASFKMGEMEQAWNYYAGALDIFVTKNGRWSSNASGVYQYMGDWFKEQQRFEEAKEYYVKSLKTISLDTTSNNGLLSVDQVTHLQQALRGSQKIGQVLVAQYESTEDIENLKEALQYYEQAIRLSTFIHSSYQLERSKAQLALESKAVFKEAIETCFELFKATDDGQFKEATFKMIEKSKSPILLEAVVDSEAKKFDNIPDSLLSAERNLRVELSYYKNQLREASMNGDSEVKATYQKLVFDTQLAIENLKESLRDEFPNYYAYKYSNEIVSVKDLQAYLPEGTVLIEYFETSSEYYVVMVDRESFEVNQVVVPDGFDGLLSGYQRSLTDNEWIAFEANKADSAYAHTASGLFKCLLSPFLNQINGAERIIVVPDGKLSQINFGTFLTTQASMPFNYKDLDFLIRDYSISYAHSATLNFRQKSNSARGVFGGFGPSYQVEGYADVDSASHPMAYQLVRSGQLPLPGAISEVLTISDLMNGIAWVNTEASESNFKQNSANYRILHLAMHSLLNSQDPEYSELLFNNEIDSMNDGYLTIDEIYNLELNAEMTVLSACSSGAGKIQEGEGPISFTRAFSYAGCPSIIMSMWKLPDAATNQIMISFYQNIKAGDSKDLALRKAQLAYLDGEEDPLYQHPFFWGSFVALGDTTPISTTASTNSWIYAIGIAGFLLVLLAVFRRRKRLIQQVEA